MQEYFKEVEEESIRDNFVISYELLDELIDFGYPQTTDAKILQELYSSLSIHYFTIVINYIGYRGLLDFFCVSNVMRK